MLLGLLGRDPLFHAFFGFLLDWSPLDWNGRSGAAVRVSNQCIDDPRIDLHEQSPQNIVVQLALPRNGGQLAPIEPEVRKPVRALTVAVNGVCESTFVPKSAGQHLAAMLLDNLGNLT